MTLGQQLTGVKSKFPIYDDVFKNNKLHFFMNIQPTEFSTTYKVKVEYMIGKAPRVYLIEPELRTYNGKKPHHLYPSETYPRLCLYSTEYNEWTPNKSIADTIIPWISTWLFAYEFWLVTGTWHFAEQIGNKLKD